MPDINTHPNVVKPRVTLRLPLGIASRVVDQVVEFASTGNTENSLGEFLSLPLDMYWVSEGEILQEHSKQLQH
jgi:hypothetical protein